MAVPLAFSLFGALVSAGIGARKCSGVFGFFMGLFFGPFGILIIAIFQPSEAVQVRREAAFEAQRALRRVDAVQAARARVHGGEVEEVPPVRKSARVQLLRSRC